MNAILYTDHDAHCCEWLENLVDARLIPPGEVTRAGVQDLNGADLSEFRQVHLFAGIGGWPHALELAGWPADVPVWTGSAPCPPFSTAGRSTCKVCGEKGLRFFDGPDSVIQEFGCPHCGWRDERHLWPEMRRLVRESKPEHVFGEQVTSPLAREWLAGIQIDLEALGYTFGAADLCAAGVGAPHLRQRLFWVAYRSGAGLEGWPQQSTRGEREAVERGGDVGGVAHSQDTNRGREANAGKQRRGDSEAGGSGASGRMGLPKGGRDRLQENAEDAGKVPREGRECSPGGSSSGSRMGESDSDGRSAREQATSKARYRGAVKSASFWDDSEYVLCRDPRRGTIYRRVESGLKPLVNGLPFRLADGRTREDVSRTQVLKGLGNAIVPEVAAMFIRAFMDVKF